MYLMPLSYEYLQRHRSAIGIQGSWEAFFTLMKAGISSLSKNEENPCAVEFEIHYPLLEGAQIKGTFYLEPAWEIKGY
jgi:hypothetical protein